MTTIRTTLSICAFAGLSAVWLVCAGCATTVIPARQPVAPVAVYLSDYGIHSSLLLPTTDRRYVEYCFGDWGYAAENRNGPHDALGALLISQQSALGRRYIDIAPGQGLPHPDPAPVRITRFEAAKVDVDRLVGELNTRYQLAIHTERNNPETHISFVRIDEHYSFLNNCNNMTAWGLRELHCELHGLVGTSKFNVVQSPQPARQAHAPAPAPDSPSSARLE